MRASARTTRVPPRRGGAAPERGSHSTLGARSCFSRRGRARPAAPGLVCCGSSGRGGGCARPARPPLPLSTYRAAGRCAGVSGVGRLAHLLRHEPRVRAKHGALRRARGEARPKLGGLASAPPGGWLHLLSESLSHICGQCSCRGGGGAGLGAIIWEDAVPCPAGAVVSPLKKPAPHCSRAAVAGGRGRPVQREEEGTLAPAPDRRHPCTSCPVPVPAGSWTVRIQPARGERRRSERVRAWIDSEHSSFFRGPTVNSSHWATRQPSVRSQETFSDSQPVTVSYSETRTNWSFSYPDQ